MKCFFFQTTDMCQLLNNGNAPLKDADTEPLEKNTGNGSGLQSQKSNSTCAGTMRYGTDGSGFVTPVR
jgi:hypothetical protein